MDWRIGEFGAKGDSISEVAAKRPLDISRDAYARGPSRGKSKLASSIHSHNWPGGRQIDPPSLVESPAISTSLS